MTTTSGGTKVSKEIIKEVGMGRSGSLTWAQQRQWLNISWRRLDQNYSVRLRRYQITVAGREREQGTDL